MGSMAKEGGAAGLVLTGVGLQPQKSGHMAVGPSPTPSSHDPTPHLPRGMQSQPRGM